LLVLWFKISANNYQKRIFSYMFLPPPHPSPKGGGSIARSFSPLGETGKGVINKQRKCQDMIFLIVVPGFRLMISNAQIFQDKS
jgi:hypothetical protein